MNYEDILRDFLRVTLVGGMAWLTGRIFADRKVETELRKQIKLLKDQNDLLKEQLFYDREALN